MSALLTELVRLVSVVSSSQELDTLWKQRRTRVVTVAHIPAGWKSPCERMTVVFTDEEKEGGKWDKQNNHICTPHVFFLYMWNTEGQQDGGEEGRWQREKRSGRGWEAGVCPPPPKGWFVMLEVRHISPGASCCSPGMWARQAGICLQHFTSSLKDTSSSRDTRRHEERGHRRTTRVCKPH